VVTADAGCAGVSFLSPRAWPSASPMASALTF